MEGVRLEEEEEEEKEQEEEGQEEEKNEQEEAREVAGITVRLAVGMPPANDTFFQVAIITCFGSNLVVPTMPSLAQSVRAIAEQDHTNVTPTLQKYINTTPTHEKQAKARPPGHLMSALSHSLISMPNWSFLE